MNWAGASLVSFLTTLLGAILGAVTHYEARRRGIDFPPIVGILAGFAAASASRDKSSMRGIIVASVAVWAAAIAEVEAAPVNGLFTDLLHFNERFGLVEFFLYLGCLATAFALASQNLRRSSSDRDRSDTPPRPIVGDQRNRPPLDQ